MKIKFLLIFLSLPLSCGKSDPKGHRYEFENGSVLSGFFRPNSTFVVNSQPTTLVLRNPDGTLATLQFTSDNFATASADIGFSVVFPSSFSVSASNNLKNAGNVVISGAVSATSFLMTVSRDGKTGSIQLILGGTTYTDTLKAFIDLGR